MNDGNDPSTCMVLNIFRVLNVIMFTQVKIILFLLGCEGKIKILRGYCGGQDLSFCVGLKAPFTNKSTSDEERTFGKAP